MKNITLSVDEKVLEVVRRRAAEQNSSVNALVREYLTNLAAQEDRASKARARLVELSNQSRARLGKKTWRRDDVYDRSRVFGYEYPGSMRRLGRAEMNASGSAL
jgi:plasmid stability protein